MLNWIVFCVTPANVYCVGPAILSGFLDCSMVVYYNFFLQVSNFIKDYKWCVGCGALFRLPCIVHSVFVYLFTNYLDIV